MGDAHLALDAEQIPEVVAHLVRDDVRLRELAGSAEARRKFAVEAKVDVHSLVGRAVEWPHPGGGLAAARACLIPEQHEPRWPKALNALAPHPLHVVEGRHRDLLERGFGRVTVEGLPTTEKRFFPNTTLSSATTTVPPRPSRTPVPPIIEPRRSSTFERSPSSPSCIASPF